jgi:hypothetical protein
MIIKNLNSENITFLLNVNILNDNMYEHNEYYVDISWFCTISWGEAHLDKKFFVQMILQEGECDEI